MQALLYRSRINNVVNNGYLDGLRKHDARPLHPIVVPRDTSPHMMRKMMFEHQLLEERALHEFSAGKGDGAGVDTGSAPLKPSVAPVVPTSLPLTTPNIYFAGLTFGNDNPNIRNVSFKNPYTPTGSGNWIDATGGYEGHLSFSVGVPPQGFWILRASAEGYNEEEGQWNWYGAQCAYATGTSVALPLTGWVLGGGSFNVTGTLIISTTA